MSAALGLLPYGAQIALCEAIISTSTCDFDAQLGLINLMRAFNTYETAAKQVFNRKYRCTHCNYWEDAYVLVSNEWEHARGRWYVQSGLPNGFPDFSTFLFHKYVIQHNWAHRELDIPWALLDEFTSPGTD